MKNIHVLPTNKPNSLYYSGNNSEKRHIFYRAFGISPQNIYITSDEEIKEGDWVYCLKEGFEPILKQKVNPIGVNNDEMMKKIILTDNKDLIKDGVQSIDDDFLEWFVKNPSFEFVEVTEYLDSGFSYGYKIIIPKEEPFKHKVEVLSKEEILANRSNAYEFIDFYKQETLEELKKWREEALIAHEINQKVIKKLMDEKSEQIDSEKKIDKILQKLEEIKIMINRIN